MALTWHIALRPPVDCMLAYYTLWDVPDNDDKHETIVATSLVIMAYLSPRHGTKTQKTPQI